MIRLLEQHFTDYVDYEFTADMEGDLDKIANGQAVGAAWLEHFYYGEDADPGLLSIVNNLGEIDAREINSVPIAEGITLGALGKVRPVLGKARSLPSTPRPAKSWNSREPTSPRTSRRTSDRGKGRRAHGNGCPWRPSWARRSALGTPW